MSKPSKRKDQLSLVVLLALCALLIFIYAKPQLITGNIDAKGSNLESLIYSNNYELNLSSAEKEWLKNNSVIKLGIDRAFPPFGSITDENEYIGFSADYMRFIEHRLNIKFDIYKDAPWNETMRLAKSGELDVVAALVNTKARQEFLNFSPPFAL